MSMRNPIVSLLDMMTFDASEFYRATALLRSIQSIVDNIEKLDQQPSNPITEADAEVIRTHLDDANTHFKILFTRVTEMATDELIYSVSNGCRYQDIARGLEDINNSLRRELKLTKLLILERAEERYFDPEESLFGDYTEFQFPTAAYEIDEASKCMALGRYTATVFHLMRLLEIVIGAVGRCLDIPDPVKEADRNWGKLLQRMKDDFEQRAKDGNAGWPDIADKALFSEIYVSLDAVRVAWRNSTMHVENKYTFEEAEHIFGAVRGLVRKVSGRLDEDGFPSVSSMDEPNHQLEFDSPPDPETAALSAGAVSRVFEQMLSISDDDAKG